MSKSLLIGAIRRVVPEIHSDVARGIVDSILATISAELVSQGSFTLHKIGSLTLQRLQPSVGRRDDGAANETDELSPSAQVPTIGVSAKYHASRLLAARVRKEVADRTAAEDQGKSTVD